jgi:hypothetical protein
MSKQAGGRPAKSGARRELKTFRLVPDAIERLERLAGERGGSTSDVLNELLLEARARYEADLELGDAGRQPRLEVLGAHSSTVPAVARFRVLPGKGKAVDESDPRVAHELERLRDALGGVLGEIEDLMAEQLAEVDEPGPKKGARHATKLEAEYGSGFRAGMLEALETAYALLQAELLISDM